jgi:hypothetical protein
MKFSFYGSNRDGRIRIKERGGRTMDEPHLKKESTKVMLRVCENTR